MNTRFRDLVGLGVLSLLAFSGFVRAQETPAQKEKNELLQGVDVQKKVEFANVGGKSLTMDLYIPKNAPKPMPVIMWVHGGGWAGMGNFDNPTLLAGVKAGFALADINYRLSQEAVFPAQIYDCKAAVRWLRANAAKYGFDPDKIAACGSSAGGHLVALLGTTESNPAMEGNEGTMGVSSDVQAVCDFFGPTDLITFAGNGGGYVTKLLGGPANKNPDKARFASPMTYVSAKACPFFIAHGDKDKLVPIQQSITFNDALQKAGVVSSLYVVVGKGHAFNDKVATQKALDFLRQTLHAP